MACAQKKGGTFRGTDRLHRKRSADRPHRAHHRLGSQRAPRLRVLHGANGAYDVYPDLATIKQRLDELG
jgi:hypothetical protein